MNLDYAVERLYDSGWSPGLGIGHCDTLPDGRLLPSLESIHREFEQAGLELSIKHHPTFNTYRATWAPAIESTDAAHATDALNGTVIGSSEREAAVYALAQLRTSKGAARPLMMA